MRAGPADALDRQHHTGARPFDREDSLLRLVAARNLPVRRKSGRRILPQNTAYGNSAEGMRARMIGTLRASPFEFGVLS